MKEKVRLAELQCNQVEFENLYRAYSYDLSSHDSLAQCIATMHLFIYLLITVQECRKMHITLVKKEKVFKYNN